MRFIQSPNEGASFTICGQPVSPGEVAFWKKCDESELPSDGAHFGNVIANSALGFKVYGTGLACVFSAQVQGL